jgi:hypothetical protein
LGYLYYVALLHFGPTVFVLQRLKLNVAFSPSFSHTNRGINTFDTVLVTWNERHHFDWEVWTCCIPGTQHPAPTHFNLNLATLQPPDHLNQSTILPPFLKTAVLPSSHSQPSPIPSQRTSRSRLPASRFRHGRNGIKISGIDFGRVGARRRSPNHAIHQCAGSLRRDQLHYWRFPCRHKYSIALLLL